MKICICICIYIYIYIYIYFNEDSGDAVFNNI